MAVSFKFKLDSDIRPSSIDTNTLTLSALRNLAKFEYKDVFIDDNFQLKYTDADNDIVTIAKDEVVKQAVKAGAKISIVRGDDRMSDEEARKAAEKRKAAELKVDEEQKAKRRRVEQFVSAQPTAVPAVATRDSAADGKDSKSDGGSAVVSKPAAGTSAEDEDEDEEMDEAEDVAPEIVNVQFLQLEDWLVEGAPKKLMERKCYPQLLDVLTKCTDKRLDTALLGSGGTGKTQLLVLFFRQLAASGKTVILDCKLGCFLAAPGDDGKSHVTPCDRRLPLDALNNPKAIYLFDAHYAQADGEKPVRVFPLAPSAAVSVIAASPSHGVELLALISKLKPNTNVIKRLYLPPWSREELLLLRENSFPSVKRELLERQFERFGGNVRNTMTRLVDHEEEAEAILLKELESAIGQCDPATMLQYAESKQALNDRFDMVTHQLFSIVPTADFTSFRLEFASRSIARQVELAGHRKHFDWSANLLAQTDSAALQGFRGQVFEAKVHRCFHSIFSDKTIRLDKLLRDDAKEVEAAELKFPALPELPVYFWNLAQERVASPAYMIPHAGNFRAVDSIVTASPAGAPTAVACQMMVNEDGDHGLSTAGLKTLKKALGLKLKQPLHVIMVCPPSVLPKVKLQKFLKGKKVDETKNPAGLAYGVGLIQYRLAV